MKHPQEMMEDINLKKQKTLDTFCGSEESSPDLSGNYISKIGDGNNNLEHHPLESYVTSRPLFLQQCTLSQRFHNSHPLSCPVGTNENHCLISSGFHPFDASVGNLHFGTAEMFNCIALEREDEDSDELLLGDILGDTSFSDLEIEDSYWKELVREFDSVKDGNRNERLNYSPLPSVEKDFALNSDPTSDQVQQYTNSKHRHNVEMDDNFTDAPLLVTSELGFTPTSQDPRTCLSKTDEDLLEFFSKSPVSYIECRDSAQSSPYSDVFVSDVAARPDTSSLSGTYLKRRRPSDYSGCENREDDLLLVNGLDDSSQRSHLRRKFSFCQGSERTQCHHSESQALASLNFDSSNAGNSMQAITAFNIDSGKFPCALSVRNVSATGSKGTAHVEQDCHDSLRLDGVLPQLPFSLPSVPAEYQLVITHQSVPASNSTVQQQLTQIIMSKQPCLATDKQQKSVSKFYQTLAPTANEQTCSTFKKRRNGGMISPSNSGSDLSMEMYSPTVSAFPFENLTTAADAFDESRCQSIGTGGCARYHFPYSSSSLSEPKLEHKLTGVLDMSRSNRPAPNEIYEKHNCGCSGTGALLTSSPLCTGLGESSYTMGSIKSSHKVQSCPVSPEIHFLSKLQLTTECAKKCSWTVSTDGTRNVFASAAEQTSTARSLMPVRLPLAFRGAPTVHSRSELSHLVDGIFPPNAAIVSEQQIPPISTCSSSLACNDTISLTSEILPISSPDWSASPVVMATPASSCKSSFSSFQTSVASPPSLNNTGKDLPKMSIVRACSADAAVSESDGESKNCGCPEKSCSLPDFHSCACLLSPGCSYAQFSGADLCQSQHKATVVDCKSSCIAQVQEQSILLCGSEVIESSEDNSWNGSDCEVYSDRNCDPTVTVPSSPDILQTVCQCNSKDCGRTCQSEHEASNCNHYSEIDFHDSGAAVKSEMQNSPQNRTCQPEPPSKIDSQTTCLHLFLDAPMSGRPSESQVDDNNRITYLNKGQYYRLTMGCLSVDQFSTRATAFKSVVMVLFLDSDSSDDQLGSWRTWRDRQQSYKQRILDVDFKDSYGVHLDSMEELAYNATSFRWNVDQPVRVNISVNCLSTDFTNRKGVKGKPLLIQVDTYEYDQPSLPIHRAYCKIKVFCEKGAERKVRDEERKKESNKMTIKTDDNDINCEKANAGNKDESKVTSSVSNFVPIEDLNRIPVFFRPDDSLGLKQITKGRSYLLSSKCAPPNTDRFEKRTHTKEENIGTKKKLHSEEVMTSREFQKVLLYVRRYHDEAFTALMLQTPTVPALIDALQEKYNIEMGREIRTVYRKSKTGILVKLDDTTLRLYSNESTFIIDVVSVTSSSAAEEETALYDVILTEIDVDV